MIEFNFMGRAELEDPFPFYRQMREAAGLSKFSGGQGWAVTRYEDVRRALTDVETFSNEYATGPFALPGQSDAFVANTMVTRDPPAHTRLRGLANAEFTPRAIARWEERVRAITDELLGAVPADGGTFDLLAGLAQQLPMRLIAEMVGVPADDFGLFRRWSDDEVTAILPDTPPAVVERRLASKRELRQYFRGRIAAARTAPAERPTDLIHALVAARDEQDRLSEDELVQFLGLLIVAGNETTMNLIGNSILAFADHPQEYRKLQANRALVPAAVEEVLRYDGPVPYVLRVLARPTTLLGIDLRAGEPVLPVIGAANRDPEAFPDADRFRIDREPNANDHLSFALATHYCLGASLARLEARVALEGVLDRFPAIDLAVPRSAIRHRPSHMRGVKSLPVQVPPRGSGGRGSRPAAAERDRH